MALLPKRSRSRAGFTLIELLVVIAIIAVLVSLLGAGIFYAYTRMTETSARSDISGLASAMQAFKGQYKVYPPSQLRLCSNRTQYGQNGTNALDQISLTFINAMFPNIGNFSGIQWAGAGNTAVNEVLEGDQVLVWALGGIPTQTPSGYIFNGFATNSKDPSLVVSTPNVGKKGPFFTFPGGSRVYARNITYSTNFPSFKDAFGQQPYLYFSSNNVKNGYNPVFPTAYTYGITLPNTSGGGTATVQAYYQTAPNPPASRGTYLNPDSFQILCAGADGNFNNTSLNPNAFLWTQANPTNLAPAGKDDLSNFTDARLGVAQ